MRCYKCNSVLSDNDFCLKCGADVSVYKIVVKASNTYYNLGLEKARVRDITGAIGALKTSLDLNKNNIKARNLLGLCYYEIGEIALALSEWVISLNLKQDRNVADAYIRKIKSNPNKLEEINQATKKYNLALAKAKEGGDDVAIIQLKKVVATCPNYLKAHLFLALLYMKKGEDDRARKLLTRVLKIDRNNTLALKYLNELTKGPQLNREDGYDESKKRKALSGNDVILPKDSYKEPSSGVLTVIYILLGVVIGACIVMFLITPAKVQKAQSDNSDKLKDYSEKLSSYSVDISELEKKNKDLETNLSLAKKELAKYTGDSSDAAMYEKLITAVSYYVNNDFDNAVLSLADIDVTQLPTELAKELYTKIEEDCNGGARTFYIAGVNAYNAQNYVDSIKYLLRAYNLDNTSVDTVYYLALSYVGINDKVEVTKYVDIMNSQFSSTTLAAKLTEELNRINFFGTNEDETEEDNTTDTEE